MVQPDMKKRGTPVLKYELEMILVSGLDIKVAKVNKPKKAIHNVGMNSLSNMVRLDDIFCIFLIVLLLAQNVENLLCSMH